MSQGSGCPYCDIGLARNAAGEHWAVWSDGMKYAKACTRDDDPTYTDQLGYRRLKKQERDGTAEP